MHESACGAATRANGACRRAPMPNGRCRMHGGATPVGMALPQTKHGRYSKYLPTRLAGRYAEALADRQLLELREEVSLLDARLAEVLGRLDSGECGAVWRALREQMVAYRRAQGEGKGSEVAAALEQAERLIEHGLQDYVVWAEIRALIEERRKLVESERKRLVEMQQMLTTEQAMVLLAAVADTVRKHVHDRSALAAISAELGKLMAGEARALPVAR